MYICIYVMYIYIYTSAAYVAIRRQKYCWQGVLWDLAAVLAFLRRTLTLAAVLAVQLGAHLASNWRPLGVQLASTWRPTGAQLASNCHPAGQDRQY